MFGALTSCWSFPSPVLMVYIRSLLVSCQRSRKIPYPLLIDLHKLGYSTPGKVSVPKRAVLKTPHYGDLSEHVDTVRCLAPSSLWGIAAYTGSTRIRYSYCRALTQVQGVWYLARKLAIRTVPAIIRVQRRHNYPCDGCGIFIVACMVL